MINTYANRAAYESADKSKTESTVALIESENSVVTNGVNVVTSQPKVGDIVIYDENGDVRFIALDTYQGEVFPSAWETVGVVAGRRGNMVYIVSKENATKKYMEVYPYEVSGYTLDGEQHTVQLRLHGLPGTSSYFDFTYSASDMEGFCSQLVQFLSDNGLSDDWSAYVMDGKVYLQYDSYVSVEYYTANITQATGLTLKGKCEIDSPSYPPSIYWRKCGNQGLGVWHAGRAKEYFRSDLSNTAYNPSTDVSSVPSYPVCWPAFQGKSQYQSDHCLWLRQQYCADPADPKIEEWEAYIDSICHIVPYMIGIHSPKWRDGKVLTDEVKDVVYKAKDGSFRKLYTGIDYCSQFMGGKGYMPSMTDFIVLFGELTYGLSGVTRETSDPINRSLYVIGGSAISAAVGSWVSGRGSVGSARVCYSNGGVDYYSFYGSGRCVPLSLYILPSGSIED